MRNTNMQNVVCGIAASYILLLYVVNTLYYQI